MVPTTSQTVGPFFSIGLRDLIDEAPALEPGRDGCITVHGQVIDAQGAGVPDAMLEFWSPTPGQPAAGTASGYAPGFRRSATDADGNFSVVVQRPTAAPYLMVLVFTRGLLRHLLTRLYFEDAPVHAGDALLQQLPAERRATLMAQREGDAVYRWSIILQGPQETVFFAW